jgi:hypothetical protein
MEGQKNDQGKVQMGLLPPGALYDIAEVFTFGANKYTSWNWSQGLLFSRVYDAMQRHLNSWWQKKDLDEETGKSHLAHAGCCIMMLIELEKMTGLYPEIDDRPEHYEQILRDIREKLENYNEIQAEENIKKLAEESRFRIY